ncbi:hypothetical protein ACHAQH_004002 [Verticillium albo-atrum]
MALISTRTIITSLCFFHMTLGFYFLTSPSTIADQGLVFVLGGSMGMPSDRAFESRSAPLAFVAALLIFMGISDLMTLSMPEEISLLYYWGTQAPLRLSIALGFVFYTLIAGPSSPLYRDGSMRDAVRSHNPHYTPSAWGGDGLKNGVFFTFMFVEMVSWFWVWVTLREERTEVVKKSLKQSNSTLRQMD